MMMCPGSLTLADYNRETQTIRFNVSRLGAAWFHLGPLKHLALIVHEFGHDGGGHLAQGFVDKLCEIAARLAVGCDDKTVLFLQHGEGGRPLEED
jgi:hypothetical protein